MQLYCILLEFPISMINSKLINFLPDEPLFFPSLLSKTKSPGRSWQSSCWGSSPKAASPLLGEGPASTAASSTQPQHPKNNQEKSGGCFPLGLSKWLSHAWGRIRMVVWGQSMHQCDHALPPGFLGHILTWYKSQGPPQSRSIQRTGTSQKKTNQAFTVF